MKYGPYRKRDPKPSVNVTASAKAEASAVAKFSREKKITERVPEDVTRAKAGAWLDLISPITEWAGLKGDQLRHKRELLRLQREETLNCIGERVQKALRGRSSTVNPVPMKILVPYLEKASLEDPADTTMVDMWANLLLSASDDASIPPRLSPSFPSLAAKKLAYLHR